MKNVRFNEVLLRSMLNMLFDYYIPDDAEADDKRNSLENIHSQLKSILLFYLNNHPSINSINICSEYLLEDYDRQYHVENLLYILSNFFHLNGTHIITDLYNANDKDCFCIIKIFLLLLSKIVFMSRIASNKIGDSESIYDNKKDIGCTDQIIAHLINILLTIQWTEVIDRKSIWEFIEKEKKRSSNILYNPTMAKDLLGIELTIVLNDSKSVTELSRLQILLWFYVEDMRSVVSEKEGKIDIKSKDLITMGLNTSIGTARGILYTRLKGTFLEKFPLPLLNPSEILTNIANKRNG